MTARPFAYLHGAFGLLFMVLACAANASPAYDIVRIVTGDSITDVERRYADLLMERLGLVTSAKIEKGSISDSEGVLNIVLGTAQSNPNLARLADDMGIPMPSLYDPGREGFVLASSGALVLAAGFETRGVLYAVGEILRRGEPKDGKLEFPGSLHLRCAPRWPIRGLMVTQGFTLRELTGSREWSEKELRDAHLDYALAGANTFELGETGPRSHELHDFLKSYGLDTMTIISANAGSGPPEWRAKEAIGRQGYLSPGIPAARAALIEQHELLFKEMPKFDYVHFKSGDGGGDESEISAPYGAALIKLCEAYAPILRRYNPNVKIYVGNQKLDNSGDMAILRYLQSEERDWLSGICYGPGSNAMGWTPGRRQDHRMDLFQYGGRGGGGGYLKELLHQLPPGKTILLFTDLTHWVYSQYGLMDHELIPDRDHNLPPPWDDWMYRDRPDPALAAVYDRRTFHARPRNYWKVFQETSPYIEGDVAYSEGHHDHPNQWMYQRMFWNPHQSPEEMVTEYARAHFGSASAQAMTDAIFQLEQNLQTPIEGNSGLDRLITLLQNAAQTMPSDLMARNHLWREFMQKAYLDKYIQLDAARQRAFYEERVAQLAHALETGTTMNAAITLGDVPIPEPSGEMIRLKDLTDKLGQESNMLHGVRSEGFFNLKQDYHGYGWLQREIRRAAKAGSEEEARRIVQRIVHYEDPGPGGFYDDAGKPGGAPRMIHGWAYGDGIFSDANRPSQRTMAFTTHEEQGVAFRYKNLDPTAQYMVRLTLVRPKYLDRFGKFQPQTRQSIYADDHPLALNLELPEHVADFYEYFIPHHVTADGELLLWMKKAPGIGEGLPSDVTLWRNTGGWGTLVSEVWLIRQP